MTPVEARFEMDRQLVALAATNGGRVPLVSDVRFFLYPDPSRRLVMACAERADGAADIAVFFETALPVDPDDFNEETVRQMFFNVPSGARH
jgi:hypothetical protein